MNDQRIETDNRDERVKIEDSILVLTRENYEKEMINSLALDVLWNRM